MVDSKFLLVIFSKNGEGKEILKDLKLNLNEYEGIAHAVIGYKDQETISKVIKENRAIFLI